MGNYSESRTRYRRLFKLTFLPLAGCFVCVFLIATFNPLRNPVLGPLVATADTLCFLTFAVNGIRLGRFRCPRCSEYYSRGKRVYRPRGRGPRCRGCGLELLSSNIHRSRWRTCSLCAISFSWSRLVGCTLTEGFRLLTHAVGKLVATDRLGSAAGTLTNGSRVCARA